MSHQAAQDEHRSFSSQEVAPVHIVPDASIDHAGQAVKVLRLPDVDNWELVESFRPGPPGENCGEVHSRPGGRRICFAKGVRDDRQQLP